MSVSVLGLIFLLLGLATWLTSRRAFARTLAASTPFATTAAVTIGGNGVPPFYILAVFGGITAIYTSSRGRHIEHLSLRLIGIFFLWSGFATAVGPSIFAGIPVLDPRGGIDNQVHEPTPLSYSPSMGAQIVYLALGALVAWYLAQSKTLDPGLLTLPFAIGGVLSIVRLVPGVAAISDPIFRDYGDLTFNFYGSRNFGIFAEPSFLAVFSISALAYFVVRMRLVRGWRLFGLVILAIVTAVNLATSGSGTAALAVLVLGAVAMIYFAWQFLLSRLRLSPMALMVPFLVAAILMTRNPLRDAIVGTVSDKSSSESFVNRNASDLFSLDLAWHTFGIGVGLGASRPSSFFTMLLSNVGIVGVVLVAFIFAKALLGARGRRDWVPAAASLIALLTAKIIAEPALSTPLMWLILGVCIYASRSILEPEDTGTVSFPEKRSGGRKSSSPLFYDPSPARHD